MLNTPFLRSEGIMQGHSYSQPKTTVSKARFAPTFKHAKINFMGITPSIMTRWVPILGFWSVGAGAGLALYLSDIPKFKKDVLDKVPLVRQYFVDSTPDSDKPF